MPATAPPVPSLSLAPSLQAIAPAKLAAARVILGGLNRDELLNKFRSSFHSGKRLASLLTADELIKRGTPPVFFHDPRSKADNKVEQVFDLFVYDIRWLRVAYPNHAGAVRYQRGKLMLTGTEKDFWREVEFAFYMGKRPAWKLVGSLSLNEKQQTDSAWLRSAPVSRRLQEVAAGRDTVFSALQQDVKSIRRIATFTDDDAKRLLVRRHQLWFCGQMARGKPTETALRYFQLTGQIISRALAAKHLEKVADVLRRIETTSATETGMT